MEGLGCGSSSWAQTHNADGAQFGGRQACICKGRRREGVNQDAGDVKNRIERLKGERAEMMNMKVRGSR